ncbi:MAG: site-2 protease family protein, partial [Planctomycetota bacterium]
MMIELLAASDPGFFENLGTQFYQWGVVALGIGFVIFVHELGHFAAAKMFGVKCEKFYVGFDVPMPKIGPFQLPSTLGKFRYGETEYGLGILPLGGYVKMLGQDDDPRRLRE